MNWDFEIFANLIQTLTSEVEDSIDPPMKVNFNYLNLMKLRVKRSVNTLGIYVQGLMCSKFIRFFFLNNS